MNTTALQFLQDDAGATAIEYGLIAALIAVTIVVAVSAIGSDLIVKFDSVANAL